MKYSSLFKSFFKWCPLGCVGVPAWYAGKPWLEPWEQVHVARLWYFGKNNHIFIWDWDVHLHYVMTMQTLFMYTGWLKKFSFCRYRYAIKNGKSGVYILAEEIDLEHEISNLKHTCKKSICIKLEISN
jgi:hypothetical protein